MTKKISATPSVSLDDIQESLASSAFEMDEEVLKSSMAKVGLDFERSCERGRNLVSQLANSHRRALMRKRAEAKRRRDATIRASLSASDIQSGIESLLRKIRGGGAQFQMAFRDRQLHEFSEEELRELAEEIFWAEKLGGNEADE